MSPTTPHIPSASSTSAASLARARGRGMRGGLAWGSMLQAGIWLVFLAYPAYLILRGDLTGGERLLASATLVLFALAYLLGFGRIPLTVDEGTERAAWRMLVAWWAVLIACGLVLSAVLGGQALAGLTPYYVATIMFTLPPRLGLPLAAIIVLGATGAAAVSAGPQGVLYLSGALYIGSGMVIVTSLMEHRERGRRQTAEALQAAREREQVARDVHDLLGHSLTVINLKAEVASRLVASDPEAARAELEQISRISRTALAEVRSTVTRLRQPDFAGQIRAAARALETAGVGAELPDPQAAQDAAGADATVFSWALREAVTNVVRHARAGTCRVTVTPGLLEVADDGVGWTGRCGDGLQGLSRRIAESGGRLEILAAGHEEGASNSGDEPIQDDEAMTGAELGPRLHDGSGARPAVGTVVRVRTTSQAAASADGPAGQTTGGQSR